MGLQNYYFLFFDGRWNIYSLIDGILLYLEDVSVGGEELAKGLKPIRKGKIFWIIYLFSMSALCRIAFCADMNSYLVQYEQQRHWTGQVIKSNIHQTLYWSSLPRGSGELNPNPHFWILLPCQWVPVIAASHFILLQSGYLFTLWRRVAEMNSICHELLYYVNGSTTMIVCMRDWSTVLPVFQGSFPKYTQAYLSTAVFLLKNINTTVSFWFKSNYTKFSVILI